MTINYHLLPYKDEEVKWSEVAQSCLTLWDPMDCSLPGSSVLGIFQARVLEWVAISFSWGSSQPRDRTRVSCTAGRRFTIWATRRPPKLLNRITTWERNSTLKYIPKRTGNLCSKTNVDTNVHSSINHNSKELVTTHITNWWLDKQNIVYSHTGILFRKKELPTDSRGWGEGQRIERDH